MFPAVNQGTIQSMVVNKWDSTDRRIFGKIASCERRPKMFWPSVRLIAHDLRLPKSTVQDHLTKLENWGVIVVTRFGPYQLARRNTRNVPAYGHKRPNPDKPPFQGEVRPAAPRASACEHGISAVIGAGVLSDGNKDPPEVRAMVGIALRAGLRTSLPLGIRDAEVAVLCRSLHVAGLDRHGLRYLVWRTRKAKSPVALLGHWLKSVYRWKDVLADKLMGRDSARKNWAAQDAAERAHRDDWMRDYPDLAKGHEPVHIGAGIDKAMEMFRR